MDLSQYEDNDIVIQTNKYQTPVTKKLLMSLDEESREKFLEDITTIPFIKNLISPDRLYYKDLPRDEEGKAIVDITNPPIMEDADFFRQRALHFLEHGCYTFLRPNHNPNSEYFKFWREERRRCYHGLVRESDGAWVTGLNYWYLNYHPMMVNQVREGKVNVGDRVENFAWFYEGDQWRYFYLDNARDEGKHAIELAKRGSAKSNSLATIGERNLILGENEVSCKRVNTFITAYMNEYLKEDGDGTLSKFIPGINFAFANLPFPHLTLKNSPNEMAWKMGYKDSYGIERGTFNQVMGISAKDDSDKLRGKRGWILVEEMGTFKNLLPLYNVTRRSVEDGSVTFGTIYLVGTANNKESDFTSAKVLLYNTEAYNILSNPNVYDRPKEGRPTFGYFYPTYLNRLGCVNKDGVSDVIKALVQVYEKRAVARKSTDPQTILQVIAEDPITPAEAIIKVKNAYFPVIQLQERLGDLDSNPKSFDDVYIGELVFNSAGEVEIKTTSERPIRSWKVENTTQGAIEFYALPEKDTTGKVYSNRYIIGHDPVDNDVAESSSFSSTFVFDLFTDTIVAEYTGRHQFARDNYEIVRKLCLFYNANCLYESNIKGLYAYFDEMHCTNLLAVTPEYLREKQLIKYSAFGSNAYGVRANAAINNYANDLIRDWLLTPVSVMIKDPIKDEETMGEMPRLYTLKNRALLEELIGFNPEVNVDRIRALGMVMLYRQEKIILYGGDLNKEYEDSVGKDYLGEDAFFARNFPSSDLTATSTIYD